MRERMLLLRKTIAASAVLLLAGCAADMPTENSPVAGTPARVLPIISIAPDQLADYWQLEDEPEVRAPVTGGRNLQFGCVQVNFGIDADGRPFDIQIRKSYPQGRFADHAVALIKDWQFEAVAGNPMHQPVRTGRLLTLQAMDSDVRLVGAEHVAKFCR
ncbi:TonB family protein [Permianibacter sp. IMCC34836]|uniref:TonB family protein n=1 Tax=Permianibacter fluminis TaxID=2738515 RepID=UPI00155705F2|nr:TonB family protein [Permianibacter fluminis]NQD38884.1 TonB family protein [Permianibacter fluminis]